MLSLLREWAIKAFQKVVTVYPSNISVVKKYKLAGTEFLASISNEHEGWRWDGVSTRLKEPDTLEWIDSSMGPADILCDIGACVGNYSIYSAIRHPGLRVYAFEPEPNSMIQLLKNVRLNNLPVTCFMLPLCDGIKLDFFSSYPVYAREGNGAIGRDAFIAGESNHQFGRSISVEGDQFEPTMKIGMLGCTLDYLVERAVVPVPTHIKMDVDGLERDILRGMSAVLAHPDVKSILCEIAGSASEIAETMGMIEKAGFRATRNSSSGPGNYIFYREKQL